MVSVQRRQVLAWMVAGVSVGVIGSLAGGGSVQSADRDLTQARWEEIVEAGRGSTVNWAMWSGSDQINRFVDGWVTDQLKAQYDITLNRVPLNDTVEAVNKVAGEIQAGLTSGGSIDLIWINGENFRTLKQGDLLFGPFVDRLPSRQFYDLENPTVMTDFGLPIEGYSSPYTGSYYVMAYNSAKVQDPPETFAELLDWAKANPGRFTYVAPPAFDGSRFVLTALYGTTGGFEQYGGAEFNEGLWMQNSPKTFAYLQELDPYLWREGSTYPPTQARLAELYANGEIWMMPAFVSEISLGLSSKQFPETTVAYALPGIALNDPSFTAIPRNARNPAGAMILADLLSSPEGQLEKMKPEVWGDPTLVEISKVSPELQASFAEVEKRYGIPLRDIMSKAVPVVNAEYTTRLEETWQQVIAPN